MTDPDDLGMTYVQALHAMQAGVAFEQGFDSNSGNPKQLRVGLNARACDHTALVRLLIKKEIFTEEEYLEEIRLEMNREVKRYEQELSKKFNKVVKLGTLF
jgi:hypothetical protein